MAIEVQGVAPLFQVFDMPTSIAFYRDVLGCEVVSTSQPGAGVRLGAASTEWSRVDA
jgi:catechol 2,3-dioxygenase-like lactoylglutathione lyase family enzyme